MLTQMTFQTLQQLQVGFQCEHCRQSEMWSHVDDSDESDVLVAGMSTDLEKSLHHQNHHHHQLVLCCKTTYGKTEKFHQVDTKTILITLIQPTVYQRFGFMPEAFIRTDFRQPVSATNLQSQMTFAMRIMW